MKKSFQSPVIGDSVSLVDYQKLINDIHSAVESYPPNMTLLETVLYEINSPSFKYPELKKCCLSCTANKLNKEMRDAFDILKTISILDQFEEIMRKIEIVGWKYHINDWSLKNKKFRKVRS